jgi:hypothetical protein
MRWFTRDFVTGGLSDEEWNQRRSAYGTHLNSIGAGLTDGAEELLASVHLHDGQVSEWTYRPGELLALTVLVGDLQLGYEWLTLRYRGASVVGATPADLSRWWSADAGTEIVEDEVDRVDDGGYEHRLLLWPEGEFAVQFVSLSVERRPADPSDRR